MGSNIRVGVDKIRSTDVTMDKRDKNHQKELMYTHSARRTSEKRQSPPKCPSALGKVKKIICPTSIT
jgi:hypothetical protein